MAKIWKHRDRFNKVGPRHYSYANPEMYARKIPLLQVLKYLPGSVELTTATELEYAANTPKGQQLDLKQALDGQFTHVPEQEDAAAQTTSATKPEAGVDVSTGEILPQWDEKTAIAHIRAQKTIATLKAEWKVVVKDFSGTNRALPVGVEAAYNEKIEALETGDL
jgi:recombination protein RecT